jgi:hypothetical protein
VDKSDTKENPIMNVEQVKAELRKEVRALALEKVLNGYALVCCMEDIPEDEMLEMLSHRVIRMMEPAMQKIRERHGSEFSGTRSEILHLLAEEGYRVIEIVRGKDTALLETVREFETLEASGNVN